MIPWRRFVALGDSLTEGVGDPVPGGLRGWADMLAASLSLVDRELTYVNLATRSLRTAEIRDTQLEHALSFEPDLVAAVMGMNDLIRSDFDAGRYADELDSVVAPLAGAGATVLMGTFAPDMPLLRVTTPARRRLVRAHLREASEAVLEVARRHQAIALDAPEGWRYTMRECSIDGCHPNVAGHAHIARLALAALTARAGVDLPAIDHEGTGWATSAVRHARWLARRTAGVGRTDRQERPAGR